MFTDNLGITYTLHTEQTEQGTWAIIETRTTKPGHGSKHGKTTTGRYGMAYKNQAQAIAVIAIMESLTRNEQGDLSGREIVDAFYEQGVNNL